MARIKSTNYGFSTGIISPDFHARSDHDVYPYGAKEITNFLITVHGALKPRPGFAALGQLDGAVWITPFKFKDEQEYLFVWFDQELRIYQGTVLVYTDTTNIPYSSSEVAEIRYTNSLDTLFVFHENHEPLEIKREGSHTSWTVAEISFDAVPFHHFPDKRGLTPSGTSGTINLTLDSGADYWVADHVGVRVKINDGECTITSITSGTVAVASVDNSLTNTTKSTTWEEEAWSNAHGWPRCGVFHKNRLVLAGTTDLPTSFWGSSDGDFRNFDYSKTDDETYAYAYRIDSNHADIIKTMLSGEVLLIFTDANEVVAEGNITPTSVPNVRQQTNKGSGNVVPFQVEEQTLFVDKQGRTLWSFEWNVQKERYTARNLTSLPNEILSSPADMAHLPNYQHTQTNYAFIVNDDGSIAAFGLDSSRDVLGASRIITDGTFKSLAVVDGQLYALVERDIGMCVEYMTTDTIYLDHFYTGTDASGTTSWSGATTLANETVAIVGGESTAEYSYLGTVALDGSGDFATDDDKKFVAVGYDYESELETLPVAFSINGQDMRGEPLTLVKVVALVRDAAALTIEGDAVAFENFGTSEYADDAVRFTGAVSLSVNKQGTELSVTLKRHLPLPCQINSVTVVAETGVS